MADGVRKVLLLVLDGAGYHADPHGNAVTAASMPRLFAQMHSAGFAVLAAAGQAVGLEAGQVGNSEAGHLTLGAGRMVPSMCLRILEAYTSGAWAADPAWTKVGRLLHVLGLVSDAGVHGLTRTLVQAARCARAAGVQQVVLHPVLDGVDSLAGSAPRLLAELREDLARRPDLGVRLGVIQGRKHVCDRSGDLEVSRVARQALAQADTLPEFRDEALARHLAGASEASFPAHRAPGWLAMAPGEPVLISSHRADRARQIALVLAETQPLFMLVDPGPGVTARHVFFPQAPLEDGLAQQWTRAGLASVRIAEKCKFPHVTYFFNGFDAGAEGEGRCLPSIPEAAIRQQPEMSLAEVTGAILAALDEPGRRMVVANLANLDQVGHLGDLPLAQRAAALVDAAYGRLAEAAQARGWTLFVTADHGNADKLLGAGGTPFGSHTDRPVPFVALPAPGLDVSWLRQQGSLANVAATVLGALCLQAPAWMEPPLLALHAAGGATTGGSTPGTGAHGAVSPR